MSTFGTIASLWRYPVKSMAGESLAEAFMGFSGFHGDRCYAVKNSAARKGFPYLNANVQPRMLLHQPRFRHPDRAVRPPNLYEAQAITPGVNPANAAPEDMALDVVTPSGDMVSIDDPALMESLGEGLRGENHLTLVRSDRALTDCRPVSLIGRQTIAQIGRELGDPLDERRFRANIYLDLESGDGFAEHDLVGRKLRLGPRATVTVLERDPRCKMISLDPETGEHDPEVLRRVAQGHENMAGVYCAVLVEGVLSVDDPVAVID